MLCFHVTPCRLSRAREFSQRAVDETEGVRKLTGHPISMIQRGLLVQIYRFVRLIRRERSSCCDRTCIKPGSWPDQAGHHHPGVQPCGEPVGTVDRRIPGQRSLRRAGGHGGRNRVRFASLGHIRAPSCFRGAGPETRCKLRTARDTQPCFGTDNSNMVAAPGMACVDRAEPFADRNGQCHEKVDT